MVFTIPTQSSSGESDNSSFLRTDGQWICLDLAIGGLSPIRSSGSEVSNRRLPIEIARGEVYISIYALILGALRFPEMPRGASSGNGELLAVGNLANSGPSEISQSSIYRLRS